MREINTHQINECNSALKIEAEEKLGPGGAPHQYRISYERQGQPGHQRVETCLKFQNGAIKEVGTNGITHEVLLAVLIDRLAHFQRGPYACAENETALTALLEAQAALHSRTARREAAGTEGTMGLDLPTRYRESRSPSEQLKTDANPESKRVDAIVFGDVPPQRVVSPEMQGQLGSAVETGPEEKEI